MSKVILTFTSTKTTTIMKNGQTTIKDQPKAILGSVESTEPKKASALKQIQDAIYCMSKGISKNIYLF